MVLRGQRSRLDVVAGEEGGPWCSGDQPTVGLILVQQPRGEDERKAGVRISSLKCSALMWSLEINQQATFSH